MTTPLPLIPWSKTKILRCRKILDSSKIVQLTAVDLFALGFYEQANTLLEAIHDYGLDTASPHFHGCSTITHFQRAWEATDSCPQWAKKSDDVEPYHEALCRAVPIEVGQKIRKKTLDVGDVDCVRQRMHAQPDAIYRNTESSVTLCAVIQVALLAGEDLLATKLVEEDMKDLYAQLREKWDDDECDGDGLRKWFARRQGLAEASGIWGLLKQAQLGKALGVSESDVDSYVQEGCALFKQRATKGSVSPYASKTMAELVYLLNEVVLEEGESSGMFQGVDTLLSPGATEAEIAALEDRLAKPRDEDTERVVLPGKKLPEDYKDFLHQSNGFDLERNLFSSAEDVESADVDWLHELNYTLFPNDSEWTYGSDFDQDLDNISMGEYTCIKIGTGDSDGDAFLVPPSSVRPMIVRFEKAYAKASPWNKKVYERAAIDLYGGLEKLKSLEWLCLEYQDSVYEQRIWGGFRQYLEEYVQRTVDEIEREGRLLARM